MSDIVLSVGFDLITCCTCGIQFAVPAYWRTKRREDHRDFYCPNGCRQSYMAKTAADVAREEAEKDRMRRIEAEKTMTALEREAARVRKRLSAGVCPCCNRTFQNLSRHMATKHRDFQLRPAKETRLLQ